MNLHSRGQTSNPFCRDRIMNRMPESLIRFTVCGLLMLFATEVSIAEDPQPRQTIKLQITGLFSKDRVDDLHQLMKLMPGIKLIGVDFKTAEASFEYDSEKVFPGAKPEQISERFDNLLRQSSRSTFGAKPLCAIPREKLTLIEIPVVGLDCKACCLAAYEAIYRIDGVEQATASFRDGLVTAWIDAEKTNRAALEDALKKKEVQLKSQ